ncbi:MAG TPA: hypothetical protein VFU10_03695 [Gaiellaceae bacterium]|nr:hypothetical protein [Gaiellaceae bacterium]
MSTQSASAPAPRGLGATSRRDWWWLSPLIIVVALSAFGIYSLYAILVNADYHYTGGGADYISPFYSPNVETLFGIDVPFSPALLVAWMPLGLRLTCYYYRKAYYRSFFLAPPACAVAGPTRKRYTGESKFPLVLQNVHRYFLYLAIVVLGFLWYDAGQAFFFDDGFGVGLGSLVLLVNVCFLTAFTFGCNSLRHLVGGRLDCFTCSAMARARHTAWRGVTVLNLRHMGWAWVSLTSVALADLYIRLAASGVFHDPRII